jgi:hypothetical protein
MTRKVNTLYVSIGWRANEGGFAIKVPAPGARDRLRIMKLQPEVTLVQLTGARVQLEAAEAYPLCGNDGHTTPAPPATFARSIAYVSDEWTYPAVHSKGALSRQDRRALYAEAEKELRMRRKA